MAGADLLEIVLAARKANLWQEDDGRTNVYDRDYFGLSEPIEDWTDQAKAAADAGLIFLDPQWAGKGGSMWLPTAAGERALQSGRVDA